jgi:hypothetical protein
MKLFQKLIAAPAIISMASGLAVNAAEINQPEFSPFTKSPEVISTGDFKSELLVPGDWAYDSLKDLSKSPRFNGSPVHRIEAAAELNRLIAGGEGLMNGAAIERLSDELGSELAIMKGRVDGLEARVNGIEAGSFSDTTTLSGKVEMLLAAQDSATAANNKLMANYHYEIDLNTSFTGDDKLNIELAAGNQAASSVAAFTDPLGETSEDLHMEDVNYTFPVGEWTLSVGDSMDASKNWPNACSYGNVVDNLGDCGAANSVDLGGDISFSAGRDFDNGWSLGLGVSAAEGASSDGMFSKEGDDYYGVALGYETDAYGVTVAYSMKEDRSSASGSTQAVDNASAGNDKTYWGATAYWTPGDFTISGGFEFMSPELSTDKDSTQWTVGISTDLGEGEISAGVGTNGAIDENAEEVMAYEVKYSYPLNDSVTIDTFGYVAENTGSTQDDSGVGILTTFKF